MKKLLTFLSFIFICGFIYGQKNPPMPIKLKINAFPVLKPSRISEVNCTINYPTPANCVNLIRNFNFTPTPSYIPLLHGSFPFNLNYVPEWGPSSGSAQLYDISGSFNGNPLGNPAPATGFASLAFDSELDGDFLEGIAQKISPLQIGHKYSLSFFEALTKFLTTANSTINLKIELLHCSLFATFPQNNAEPVFPPNAAHQTIYCEVNPSNPAWQRRLINFVANNNYDLIMITPSFTTTFQNSGLNIGGSINFAYPQLIDVSNFSAGAVTQNSNCSVTIGPAMPNCSYPGLVFTWLGPNGQQIEGTAANQTLILNTSLPANAANIGTWTLQMTMPSSVPNANSCIPATAPVQASVIVPACPIALWPKAYPGRDLTYLTKTDNGNILAFWQSQYLDGMTPNLNHNGPLPNLNSGLHTFQYSANGITTWTKDLSPVFAQHNGDIQMGDDNFYNSTTGILATRPNLVPIGEFVIAQTINGGYITRNSSNNIFLHTSTGNSIGVSLGNFGRQFRFNPISNKLFGYEFHWDVNTNDYYWGIDIFDVDLNTNSILLNKHKDLTNASVQFYVNDNNEVFIGRNYQLVKIDYSTPGNTPPNYIPISLVGVSNSNLEVTWNYNPYTINSCVFRKDLTTLGSLPGYACDIYVLNLFNFTSKKIHAVNFAGLHNIIDGDDIYLEQPGGFDNLSVDIGNVHIADLDPVKSQMNIVKLNINNDFAFTSSVPIQTQTLVSKAKNLFSFYEATISPNPSSNSIRITIKSSDEKIVKQPFRLQFKNRISNRVVIIDKYFSGDLINISSFEKGFYYVEIISSDGEIISKKLIKI